MIVGNLYVLGFHFSALVSISDLNLVDFRAKKGFKQVDGDVTDDLDGKGRCIE